MCYDDSFPRELFTTLRFYNYFMSNLMYDRHLTNVHFYSFEIYMGKVSIPYLNALFILFFQYVLRLTSVTDCFRGTLMSGPLEGTTQDS